MVAEATIEVTHVNRTIVASVHMVAEATIKVTQSDCALRHDACAVGDSDCAGRQVARRCKQPAGPFRQDVGGFGRSREYAARTWQLGNRQPATGNAAKRQAFHPANASTTSAKTAPSYIDPGSP